ncbi:MAG TPA: VWA domain-containing protein, partial [Thermoanaerobaculia bacterium]|nr:VWA domain-containing protein [Thermoanaerobaculia bacterium]
MTRFADPFWLTLALLVLARIALLLRDRRKRFGAFGFSSLSLVAPSRGLRAATSAIPFVLESLALLALLVALARPQRVVRLASGDRYGIDIAVALDASGSMAAEDFRPRNRFTVAKDLIAEFIRRRQDDRIGVITFGTRAATRVPITYDRRIAELILDQAEIGDHGNGTAIGHALATAVNRLRTSKTRSRVVILVTDGVNNSGSIDPIVAAQLAARSGIKVYTIGVGSEGPVPLPVKRQNPFTGQIETIYTHIRGELDEKSLSAIASMTGGEFFRATDARALGNVLTRIDQLEKTRLSAPKREDVDELYAYPLVA